MNWHHHVLDYGCQFSLHCAMLGERSALQLLEAKANAPCPCSCQTTLLNTQPTHAVPYALDAIHEPTSILHRLNHNLLRCQQFLCNTTKSQTLALNCSSFVGNGITDVESIYTLQCLLFFEYVMSKFELICKINMFDSITLAISGMLNKTQGRSRVYAPQMAL